MHQKDIHQLSILKETISRAKLTVWAALCGNGVILGPYFFHQNVTGLAYLNMLNEFVLPQLAVHFGNQHWEDMFRGLWWAQDGAPAHRLIAVRDRLNAVFGNNRTIGLGHDVEWPPRSPDLTPCDFFMWGYLKDKVFSTGPPENIDVLRQRISDEFDALRRQPDFIRRAAAICTSEPYFVWREMGDMLKDKALDNLTVVVLYLHVKYKLIKCH
jgi:hypothetical protein